MKFIFSTFLILFSADSFAASCCGGGFAFPALILGDDKAQVTTSYSYGTITDHALSNGQWTHYRSDNRSDTMKLDGAMLLTDSLQAGVSVPVIRRQVESENSSGFGDVSINLGHETMPELSYSPWKPKGISFLQIILPTSSSVYESSNFLATDSRGRGFFSLGAGMVFTKVFGKWDANASGELHHSFPRHFDKSDVPGGLDVTPGWGHSLSVGTGWNYKDWRFGTSLATLYEDPIKLRGDGQDADGSVQRNMTWSAIVNYMLGMESALTFSYADQTLFGAPSGSDLSKTVTLSYQQRWQR